MHRHRINQHIFVLHIRVLFRDFVRDLAPHARGRHNVGLIYGCDFLAPLSRQFKRRTHEAGDLPFGVEDGINRFASRGTGAAFAGLAIIDTPSEFPHDDQINPLQDFGFQCR